MQVLAGLVGGLLLGMAAQATGSPALGTAVSVVEPLGALFIAGIRMTVVPLVVASLIVGVGSSRDPGSVGRLGARAMLVFVVMLALSAGLGLLAGPMLLGVVPFDPSAAAALRAGAAMPAGAPLGLRQWLLELVPVNPVKAAADGAMLPLIVFSLLFGAALIRVQAERREALLAVLGGIQDASLQLVRWVLMLAPIGVFGLAAPLAQKLGAQAAGAVAAYVVGVVLATVVFCAVVLYPAVALLGRVPLRLFARAALPAQAVAFSSRSSLAALPAMIESARDTMRLPTPVSGFFIPLAASTFRAGAGVGVTIATLFLAKLYGVELGAGALVTVWLTTIVSTFSIPGIPGGSIIAAVPVLLGAGIPVEGVGILLGVDTIPDMFRTTTNVTADLAAATLVSGDDDRAGGLSDQGRAAPDPPDAGGRA